mgnify:CR=1 FL=1
MHVNFTPIKNTHQRIVIHIDLWLIWKDSIFVPSRFENDDHGSLEIGLCSFGQYFNECYYVHLRERIQYVFKKRNFTVINDYPLTVSDGTKTDKKRLLKRLSTIEPCKQLWMVVCWNLITIRTNSHGDLTWFQLEGFSFWSTGNCGNRLIFKFHYSIFRNVEKLGVMLFDFSFGKLYGIQSICIKI